MDPTGNMQLTRASAALRELEVDPISKVGLETAAESKEETEHYETFAKDLFRFLEPVTLNNYGYVSNTFGATPHVAMWTELRSHFGAMQAAGMKAFLDSGTLLGLIRDGKLIANDNDINLAIILDAKTQKEVLEEWTALPGKLRPLGILDKDTAPIDGVLKLKSVAGFGVDLFPARAVGRKMFVLPHTFGEIKLDDAYPFVTCKITGLPIHAKPEKIIAVNYGPNWQTPDPIFSFIIPKAFVPFRRKLQNIRNEGELAKLPACTDVDNAPTGRCITKKGQSFDRPILKNLCETKVTQKQRYPLQQIRPGPLWSSG